MVDWGGIFETIYLNASDTIIADAFRKAVGLPSKHRSDGPRIAYERESVYANVDFEKLMGQRYGVRM